MLYCRHCGAELKSDKEAGRDGAVIYVYVCGCDESMRIAFANNAINTNKFNRGDKVVWGGTVYDFGYISGMGYGVVYIEGECNMQDAIAVDLRKLEKC